MLGAAVQATASLTLMSPLPVVVEVKLVTGGVPATVPRGRGRQGADDDAVGHQTEVLECKMTVEKRLAEITGREEYK